MTHGIVAIAENQRAALLLKRPKFSDLWKAYPVHMPAPDVYKMVGGQIYALFLEKPKAYENACALRLSRSFNYGGFAIRPHAKGYTAKGTDGKPYMLRVDDIAKHVRANLGKPDIVAIPHDKDVSSQFRGRQGILIFTVSGWGDATGHVTLWDGADCGDHCYWAPPLPGLFETKKIEFWELK